MAVYALLHRSESGPAIMRWAAAAGMLIGLIATAVLAAGKAPRFLKQRIGRTLAFLAGPALVLVAGSGGFSSPAATLPALFVLAVAARKGLRFAGAAAVVAILVMAAAETLTGGSASPAHALAISAVIGAAGLVPLWYARRSDEDTATARQRLARVEGYLAERRLTPIGSPATPSDLKRDAQEAHEAAEGIRDLESLDRYLRDIRDTTGADEVIFWRWNESRGTQLPAAWSTEEALAPRYFSYEDWAPLVKWSAEGEMVQCMAVDELAYFVAGPVIGRGRPLGVLSLSAAAGLTVSAQGAKEWMSRYAAHVALMVELLELRRDSQKNRRQLRALAGSAERLNAHTSLHSLGKAIAETALEVSSGKRAALIRWDPEAQLGLVQGVAGGFRLPQDYRVASDSLISDRCAQGLPLVKEDARTLSRTGSVFGVGEPPRAIGSLAIVPLSVDRRVIGALLVESEKAGEVTTSEGRNLGLLAMIAAGSLQSAWQIERAAQHARVDQLTGLWNRRHFDEQLDRVLKETDRHGVPCSLIVADVDHFKRVNDTFGHEAGDEVLKHVGRTFADGVRTVDICARFGGEEIAVLLPHTGLVGAMELAERLRRALETRPARFQARDIAVTASFGVACYPETAAAHDGFFHAADRALYQAKSEGRNRVKAASASGDRKAI
jgi:diguanylate cyclase (GGDEF)-like protein